jgi:ABC-type transport system involved in cytochrome bd biosynthesis fused ATPase/permease subunit
MYPVWFLSYRNKDRVTYATVNGQTGKAVADLPIDIKKYLIGTAIMAAIIFMILNVALVLRPSVLLTIAAILTVTVFIINWMQRSSIRETVEGTNDKGLTHVRNKLRLRMQKRLKKSGESTENNEGNGLPAKMKVEEAEMAGFEKISLTVGIVMVIIELLTVFVFTPVSDIPYYVMVIIDAVIFIFCFRYTLINYNLMATRRLPQFDRKGGDDRA